MSSIVSLGEPLPYMLFLKILDLYAGLNVRMTRPHIGWQGPLLPHRAS